MESKSVLLSSQGFFGEAVEEACIKRHIDVYPAARTYLVQMLEHYLDARNLFDNEIDESTGRKKHQTLAEMFLIANQSPTAERFGILKKLADRSLYISGFFGDSLSRKVVDVDYYAEMGGAAYMGLADTTREDTTAKLYQTFGSRFLDFVEVLTYISQKTMVQSDQNILRLYDRYMRTGSELAREKLIEIGVLSVPADQLKLGRQD